MKKEKLINKLNLLHSEINSFINSVDSDQINQTQENNKWSIAEEIGHLINALEQSNRGICLPKFFLKYKFGTNNRQERNYDELVKKYVSKLEATPIPNNPFQIREVEKITKEKLLKDYKKQQLKFEKRLSNFNEKELSYLVLPHPLIGKLTIREFAYFTHYHTQHHFENCKQKL